jgi:hypothetical protein
VLLSLLALGACGEKPQQQQAAAPAESQVEKETIVWKLAQTWGTGFPIQAQSSFRHPGHGQGRSV